MIRLLALFFLIGGTILPAQNVLYDVTYNSKTGSRLTVTAMSDKLPASGYLAVRVEARNGEKVPASWSFDFTSRDHSWSDQTNRLSSNFSLSCQAGQRKNVEFMVPLATNFQASSEIALELAIAASPPLRPGRGEMNNPNDNSWPGILMSESLATPNMGPLERHLSGSGSGRLGSRRSSSVGRTRFAGRFIPRDLSSDWRAYSGFDAMMLTSNDWSEVPAGAKTAILKWNRLGGQLIIYAASAATDLASLGIEEDSPGQRSWGHVEVIGLTNGLTLSPAATIAAIHRGSQHPTKAKVRAEQFTRRWPLQLDFGERSFNAVFFILILIAFAIVVGPINLFVFAKSGQRHRLFITTPIISLAASLLLLVVIVLQDGFGGKGDRLALVEVRPEENTLYLQQQQIARTGVLMGTSFASPDTAIISPIALAESRWSRVTNRNEGGRSRYRILQGEKNTLDYSGDWFKSRSEYGHLITAVQASRGRLELQSPNGPPTLTSTFDFPLEKIYYIDSNKSYWTSANPLTSGKKVRLTQSSQKNFESWLVTLKARLDTESLKRLELTAERSNCFLATSSEGPFIDTLPSLNWKQSTAILTGPVLIP
jgi:hypothetical protein